MTTTSLCALPGLALPLLLLGCALSGDAATVSQAPPPPARVPANSSRVTAEVLGGRTTWDPGSLGGTERGQTLYSLQIRILTAAATDPDVASSAQAGMEIDVFSATEFEAALEGKTITATLVLTGDTRNLRWFASEVAVID